MGEELRLKLFVRCITQAVHDKSHKFATSSVATTHSHHQHVLVELEEAGYLGPNPPSLIRRRDLPSAPACARTVTAISRETVKEVFDITYANEVLFIADQQYKKKKSGSSFRAISL